MVHGTPVVCNCQQAVHVGTTHNSLFATGASVPRLHDCLAVRVQHAMPAPPTDPACACALVLVAVDSATWTSATLACHPSPLRCRGANCLGSSN